MNQQFHDISDDLLVRFLAGEATEEEGLRVKEWISRTALNKKQFEDLSIIWEESKKLAAVSGTDEEAAWQRLKGRMLASRPVKEIKKKESFNWLRVAALFILIAGGSYISYLISRNKQVIELVVRSQQLPVVDTLPDGSVATLNKNSLLSYPSRFRGNTRTITLKGEAFFQVTPDKQQPFIIEVNEMRIQVTGTSFNVSNKHGVTEVIVETGKVRVTRRRESVELGPSESLRVSRRDATMLKEKVTGKLHAYYRSKQFVCDDTPLWKLVQVLSDAYEANIIIEKTELRNLRLNTTFNDESLNNILTVISETFGLNVIKENNRILLN